MAYKIVLNTTVVDAQKNLNYVYWQVKNHLLLVGRSDFANGIVCSDGSTVWHLDGYPEFPEGSYETVKAVEITDEEYEELVKQLEIGTVEEPEDPDTGETVMSAQEMRSKILTLEDELAATKILLGVE